MEELLATLADKLGDHPYHSSKDVEKLTALLSAEPRFAIFADHIHMIGTSGSAMTLDSLAQRLVRRAQTVGARQALAEIDTYLSSDEVVVEYALLLHGIHTDSSHSFPNGVSLLTVDDMTDSHIKDQLLESRFGDYLGRSIYSALVTEYRHPKGIESAVRTTTETDWTRHEILTELRRLLEDTRLLLALARSPDYGIPVVAGATIIPRFLDFLVSGHSISTSSEPQVAIGPELIGLNFHRADLFLEQFSALSPGDQDKMRIALSRLNGAKIDPDWSNKAINLRICLENLFLRDDEAWRIGKKLRKRVPKHANFSKTRTKNVYSFLSKAVHSGRPTPDHPEISERLIAQEVQKVMISFIEAGGYPSWTS